MSLTPETQSPPLPENQSEAVLDLRKTAEESKAALAAESAALDKVPRKGGRPPGSKDKAPRAAYGSKKQIKMVPGPQPSIAEPGIETPQVSMVPAIEAVLKVPFDLAANKTGCEAIRLSPEESQPVAVEADQVISLYFPEMLEKNPKELALISLAVAIGGLGIAKLSAFNEWKQAQKILEQKNESVTESVEPAADSSPVNGGGRPAFTYFSHRAATP